MSFKNEFRALSLYLKSLSEEQWAQFKAMLQSELHRSAEAARSANVKSRTLFTVSVSGIRLVNAPAQLKASSPASTRISPSVSNKPVQKKPYRNSDYMPARKVAPSMSNKPFQKLYRTSQMPAQSKAFWPARSEPSSTARSARYESSPLARAIGHTEPRSMLKLVIEMATKIRSYTKEKLAEFRIELARYCPDTLKAVRLL